MGEDPRKLGGEWVATGRALTPRLCSPTPQVQPLVLLRHHRHFQAWHGRWLQHNVTVEAASLVQDWMMGTEDQDLVPCKTLCETAHVHGLPVTRYRVQYSRRPASP